jgi:EmrB/QacA subfamily drug resistance transporter
MSTAISKAASSAPQIAQQDPRRWRALAALGLVQFMLVLDLTVVNIALPKIQHDLGFSRPGLAWVVNGYALMAGGLLLLGGRLADIFGRRRLFLAGVGLFALASAISGAAAGPAMLVTGRFAQGGGEALAAPAALGMIALLFSDPRERMKALGIWGGLTGLGGTTGSVISGVLTSYVSWRWIFFINLPVAVFVLLIVPRLVGESRMVRDDHRLDVAGAVTVTGGLVAVVYGMLQAASHPVGSPQVLVPLLGGIGLLVAMLVIETRSKAPLIPLRFFANRTRVTANVVTLFYTAAFFTYVFLMTLFEQQVLGFSPLRGGLFYLPLGISIGLGIGIGTGLMQRIGVRPVLSLGFFGAAVGLLLSSRVHPGTSYLGGILPGMVVLGVCSGLTFQATVNAALHKVTGQDSSLASAVQNVVQNAGGGLGLACLVTLALRDASAQVHRGTTAAAAAANGYALAFRLGAVLLAIGGVATLLFLERVAATPPGPGAEPGPASEASPAAGESRAAEPEASGAVTSA